MKVHEQVAAAAALRHRAAPRPVHCLFAQQQEPFCVAIDLPSPGLMVLAGPLAMLAAGSRAMRFLISAAIVMNACSTLLAFLALVSM